MKNDTQLLIFFAFSLLSTSPCFSQAPVMTQNNTQVIGDTVKMIKVDTLNLVPGASGVGIVWDFSVLTHVGSVERYSKDPAATPYASTYPFSNLCEQTFDGTSNIYQYYFSNADSFTIVGFSGTNVDSTLFMDPDRVIKFPFTYLDSLADSSQNTTYVVGGYQLKVYSGRHTMSDGYGTLKLPNNTYSNVLRYRNEFYIKDTLFVAGNPVTNNTRYIKEYFWASSGYTRFLFYLQTNFIVNGSMQPRTAQYIENPKPAIPTGILNTSSPSAIVFPIPASDYVSLNLPLNAEKAIVKIYNITGEEIPVRPIVSGNQLLISGSRLAGSIYFYSIYLPGGLLYTGKIVFSPR